ncbi:hypothetical protein KY290_038412 [Solanum tuberosum]|uniref:Uncharacterized protein n=1 Tax=Solanum tuberosum TaxID=4113 RepID=A0ABQ7TYA9_SOLTU|nr:hypothetical protein KY290_038412 [Solanum tuberosum]
MSCPGSDSVNWICKSNLIPGCPVSQLDDILHLRTEDNVKKFVQAVVDSCSIKRFISKIGLATLCGEAVVKCKPQIDLIKNCPGRGMIITAPAPQGSGFDFYSHFFCPKFGINEDPFYGSAHCALAPYWCEKLRKCDFVALAILTHFSKCKDCNTYSCASPRGGVLNLHVDDEKQKVFLRGNVVAVMEGSLLV